MLLCGISHFVLKTLEGAKGRLEYSQGKLFTVQTVARTVVHATACVAVLQARAGCWNEDVESMKEGIGCSLMTSQCTSPRFVWDLGISGVDYWCVPDYELILGAHM